MRKLTYLITLAIVLSPSVSYANYRAIAAAILATLDDEKPAPPKPPSDECEDCNGTGKVGDGTIMVKCLTCDGTGKRKQANAPPLPVSESPAPPHVQFVAAAQPLTYAQAHAQHMQTGKPLLVSVGFQGCPACLLDDQRVIQPMQRAGEFNSIVYTHVDKNASPVIADQVMGTYCPGCEWQPKRTYPTYSMYYVDASGKYHVERKNVLYKDVKRAGLLGWIQRAVARSRARRGL